jgi:hypothetical protein
VLTPKGLVFRAEIDVWSRLVVLLVGIHLTDRAVVALSATNVEDDLTE